MYKKSKDFSVVFFPTCVCVLLLFIYFISPWFKFLIFLMSSVKSYTKALVCFLYLSQSNIGLVLHGVMEYDLSLRFLENALAINSKYHGSRSLKVALRYAVCFPSYITGMWIWSSLISPHTFLCSHHLVARVYESKAEFRSALQHEKEGYTNYKNQVHSYTHTHVDDDPFKYNIYIHFLIYYTVWPKKSVMLACLLN